MPEPFPQTFFDVEIETVDAAMEIHLVKFSPYPATASPMKYAAGDLALIGLGLVQNRAADPA